MQTGSVINFNKGLITEPDMWVDFETSVIKVVGIEITKCPVSGSRKTDSDKKKDSSNCKQTMIHVHAL